MAEEKIKLFKPMVFEKYLKQITEERNRSFHCSEKTYDILEQILNTDYDERRADLDYLMDIVNVSLERTQCTNKKRFPISKYLDWACQNDLYVHTL